MPKTEPTAPPPPTNQVILAITRAQHAALRWIAAPAKRKPDPSPATRVLDSLRWKRLTDGPAYLRRAERNLTPAGCALLAALELLNPKAPPPAPHDRASSTRHRRKV